MSGGGGEPDPSTLTEFIGGHDDTLAWCRKYCAPAGGAGSTSSTPSAGIAAMVDDLPQPAGPVNSTIPWWKADKRSMDAGRPSSVSHRIPSSEDSASSSICCSRVTAIAASASARLTAEAPTDVGDATLLEVLAAGGAAYGLPLIPGVEPDMDLDGDGLERLLVDEDGRLETCVDGDLSTRWTWNPIFARSSET